MGERGLGEYLERAAVIATVRAPVSELTLWVNYHLNIGVDHILLFFDDPDDEAVEVLASYDQVTAVRCSAEYWSKREEGRHKALGDRQVFNVNEGARMLASRGCEWIIHIDSDELIHPLGPLKEILRSSKDDAVRFLGLEAVPLNEEYENIFKPTLFKVMPNRIQMAFARILCCSRAIFEGEYFRSHTASKMAVRTSAGIKQYRIHKAIKHEGPLTVTDTKKIQLLHYDCIGFEDWKSKWDKRLGDTGMPPLMRESRRQQMRSYEAERRKGGQGLALLYDRLYHIPAREKMVLKVLGMLRHVEIDGRLFNAPHAVAAGPQS
ncbi:MAG: glycosyltransferase family 2 protein [Acidobacteriota bacterium]|jgi:hypothetical protein